MRPSPTATALLSAVRVLVCRTQPPITRGKSAASAGSLSTSFWRLATVASRGDRSSARAAAAVSVRAHAEEHRAGFDPLGGGLDPADRRDALLEARGPWPDPRSARRVR